MTSIGWYFFNKTFAPGTRPQSPHGSNARWAANAEYTADRLPSWARLRWAMILDRNFVGPTGRPPKHSVLGLLHISRTAVRPTLLPSSMLPAPKWGSSESSICVPANPLRSGCWWRRSRRRLNAALLLRLDPPRSRESAEPDSARSKMFSSRRSFLTLFSWCKLETNRCVQQKSHTLGLQTPKREEVWLDPKTYRSKHQTSGGIWKT